MHFSKKPLPFDEYEKYEIAQEYKAYIFEYLNVHEDEIDEIETNLIAQGNKLFHSNMTRVDGHLFNVEIITASVGFTF
jgi:hypothetical protein